MVEYDAQTEQIIPEKYVLEEKYIVIKHHSGKYEVKINLDTIFPLTSKIITKGKILPEGFGHVFEVHCPALIELSGVVSEENLRRFLPVALNKLEELVRKGNPVNLTEDFGLGNDIY